MGLPIVPIAVKVIASLGPTILRKFGKAKGGTTEKVADTIADALEGGGDKPEEAVARAISKLTPEQANAFAALQVELLKVKEEGKWRELDAAVKTIESDNAARVAELHQTDLYTKQTRPRIARQSWYVAGAYALLTAVVLPALQVNEVLKGGVAFNWEIFVALASPSMLYMGVRGFEKWRSGGTK